MHCSCASQRVLDDLMTFISGRLRTDLFQKFAVLGEVKVRPESGQRGLDMLNSSHAIGSLHTG